MLASACSTLSKKYRHTQLSEDAHVRAFKANARLQQGDELLKEAPALVELRHLLQVICIDDDVQATQLCQPELSFLNTCVAYLQSSVHFSSQTNNAEESL